MVLAKARIQDFERFKATFTTDGAVLRRSHGSKGAHVYQNADDPHEIWVLFDWPMDGWKSFLADPASREVMAKAGLEGPPESISLEHLADTDS
jgi:hypothetical protein